MNGAGAAVLCLSFVLGLLPLALVLQVRNLNHSAFRAELWLLRDRLMDDILHGRIEASPQAERLVRRIEAQTRIVGRHNLADVFLVGLVWRGNDLGEPQQLLVEGPPLTSADQERLTAYLEDMNKTGIEHLLRSSVLGTMSTIISPGNRRGNPAPATPMVVHASVIETQVMPDLVAQVRRGRFGMQSSRAA